MKIPKDLGLKLGTKDEVLWTDVKKECQSIIEGCEKTLIFQNEVLKLAEKRILEEKAKMKDA